MYHLNPVPISRTFSRWEGTICFRDLNSRHVPRAERVRTHLDRHLEVSCGKAKQMPPVGNRSCLVRSVRFVCCANKNSDVPLKLVQPYAIAAPRLRLRKTPTKTCLGTYLTSRHFVRRFLSTSYLISFLFVIASAVLFYLFPSRLLSFSGKFRSERRQFLLLSTFEMHSYVIFGLALLIVECVRRLVLMLKFAYTGPLSKIPGPWWGKFSAVPWMISNVTGNSMNQIPGYFEKHRNVIRVGRLISSVTSSKE
jgi:hypothetical protein